MAGLGRHRWPLDLFTRTLQDSGLRRLARRSVGTYALRIAGAAAGFVFHVVMARSLGAGGAGVYYLGLAIATLGSLLSRLGLDNALLRIAASEADRDGWPALRGVDRSAHLLAGTASLVLTTALVLGSDLIASVVFHKPDVARIIRIMALSVAPLSLLSLHGETFKAVGASYAATVIQGLAVPLTSLVIMLIAFSAGAAASVETIAWCYTGATGLVWLGSAAAWRIVLARRPPGLVGYPARRLLDASLPLLFVVSLSAAMAPASMFLLGIWLPVEAIGLYGVAQRCASLLLLVFAAVSTVSAPRFAALHSRGELAALGAFARRSALVGGVIAAPFLIAFLPFGARVLSVFGAEFVSATTILGILTLGQFLAVLTGNANDLLMMSGQEKILRNIVAVTTITYVGMLVGLVPAVGVDGAAAARAVQLVATNIFSAIYVYKKIGVNLVPGPWRVRGGTG